MLVKLEWKKHDLTLKVFSVWGDIPQEDALRNAKGLTDIQRASPDKLLRRHIKHTLYWDLARGSQGRLQKKGQVC